MKDFQAEVDAIWDIYSAAWEPQLGLRPRDARRIRLLGKEMKQILKPDLVSDRRSRGPRGGFCAGAAGRQQALKPANGNLFPTGLLKILYYQRLIKECTGPCAGSGGGVPDGRAWRRVFMRRWSGMRRKLGYGDCEMSWILEDNVLMNRSLEVLGAKRYKTYRIYEWN